MLRETSLNWYGQYCSKMQKNQACALVPYWQMTEGSSSGRGYANASTDHSDVVIIVSICCDATEIEQMPSSPCRAKQPWNLERQCSYGLLPLLPSRKVTLSLRGLAFAWLLKTGVKVGWADSSPSNTISSSPIKKQRLWKLTWKIRGQGSEGCASWQRPATMLHGCNHQL